MRIGSVVELSAVRELVLCELAERVPIDGRVGMSTAENGSTRGERD